MKTFVAALAALLVAVMVQELVAGQQAQSPAASEIQFDSIADFLRLPPGTNLGEVPGVAVDSQHRTQV